VALVSVVLVFRGACFRVADPALASHDATFTHELKPKNSAHSKRNQQLDQTIQKNQSNAKNFGQRGEDYETLGEHAKALAIMNKRSSWSPRLKSGTPAAPEFIFACCGQTMR